MTATCTIAGFVAERHHVVVGQEEIALWRVADLERHVDRHVLLAADDPPEPPYWAHLWSGALVLADAVPADAGRVLEIGCGLGLPGIVAARRGARVVFVDRVPAALAFVRASVRANGIAAVPLLAADVTSPVLRTRFDLVLGAEILYDRPAFASLADTLRRLLAPGGRALLADGGRIDTRGFYDELARVGLAWRTQSHVVREEGLPVTIALVEVVARAGDQASPYFSILR